MEKNQKNDSNIVILEGNKIQNITILLEELSNKYNFPIKSKSFDSASDWLRDLDWLNSKKYLLVIYDYNLFLKFDIENKNLFYQLLNETILPWWEKDVEQFCVEGIAKSFNVYLVC